MCDRPTMFSLIAAFCCLADFASPVESKRKLVGGGGDRTPLLKLQDSQARRSFPRWGVLVLRSLPLPCTYAHRNRVKTDRSACRPFLDVPSRALSPGC